MTYIGLGMPVVKRHYPSGLSAYLGQVATRSHLCNQYNSGTKFLRCRSGHIVREAVTSLTLVFPNFYVSQSTKAETASGGTLSLTAAIEYPSGTYTQVKFSGSATGSTSGAYLTSDAVAVSIPANATFWVRTYQQSPNGVVFIDGSGGEVAPIENSANFGDVLDASVSAMVDNTMGGAYGTNVASSRYTAIVIAATTLRPSCLLIGDSRSMGAYDSADATGDIGNLERSVGPSFGYTTWALGGYMAGQLVASHTNLLSLAPYFSHVLVELGINDIEFNAQTAAQTLTLCQSVWGYFPGKKIYQSTLEPRSSSTDSWATTANQTTSANNAQRTGFNDLIRATPSGLTGYFEVADVVETARNSGIWKAPGYTGDGLHETNSGYLTLQSSNAINPATITR